MPDPVYSKRKTAGGGELRTVPVRFNHGPLGLVDAARPHRFVERTVNAGDVGRLIVEGTPPFDVPDGWLLVKVDELYCPVHPAAIDRDELEAIR